jgi:hypothetical protein
LEKYYSEVKGREVEGGEVLVKPVQKVIRTLKAREEYRCE